MLDQIPQEVQDEILGNAVTAVTTVVYNGIAPANATGQLAQSISLKDSANGFQVVVTGPAAAYVGTLRYGRSPGKPVPVAAIENWMAAKGISGGRKVAFAIAKGIEKKGTTAYRMAPTIIWDGVITPDVISKLGLAFAEAVIKK